MFAKIIDWQVTADWLVKWNQSQHAIVNVDPAEFLYIVVNTITTCFLNKATYFIIEMRPP